MRGKSLMFNSQSVKPFCVDFPCLPSYPHEQQDKRDASCALQGLLPPAELAGHLDFDRVGDRHAVSLGDVCGVVDGAVNIFRVPLRNLHQYGVAMLLLADMRRVLHVDTVALVLGDIGRICPDRLDRHCPRFATGQQSDEEQNEHEGENHSDGSDECSQHLLARIVVISKIVVRYHRLLKLKWRVEPEPTRYQVLRLLLLDEHRTDFDNGRASHHDAGVDNCCVLGACVGDDCHRCRLHRSDNAGHKREDFLTHCCI